MSHCRSHNKHNEETGDNAGPAVLKSMGGGGEQKQQSSKTDAKREGKVEALTDGLKVCIHAAWTALLQPLFLSQ